MQKPAARTGILILMVVVATSIGWAVFVPGGSWPALAWTVLACAGAVWVAKRSIPSTRSMGDVIGDVEAEPAPAVAVAKRGVAAPKAIS